MANVRLVFESNNENTKTRKNLEIGVTENKGVFLGGKELFLEINEKDIPTQWICFDKSTAVRLSKELRRQIALMD